MGKYTDICTALCAFIGKVVNLLNKKVCKLCKIWLVGKRAKTKKRWCGFSNSSLREVDIENENPQYICLQFSLISKISIPVDAFLLLCCVFTRAL